MPNTKDSRILIVTYAFPPAAYVGVHRTLKYCKYLGRHGWRPIVLAARPAGVAHRDDDLLRDLPPEVVVHRTFDVDPAKWEDKLTERKLRRARLAASNARSEHGPIAVPAAAATGVFGRLKRFLKVLLKHSPDPHVFWVPFAFVRGMAILIRERIDVVYSTSPPHSTHLAAYLLAKCFRKPYVLDFRDPWYVSGSVQGPGDKIPALLGLETRAKRAIVRGAARVICVSKGECDELRAEFPDCHPERFTYITNGYDPADLAAAGSAASRSSRLTLVHAGTIYSGIAGEFFTALGVLIETDPAIAQSMRVQLLGHIASEYADVVGSLERAGVVEVHGMQPHARALQMVQASDVPVILMGGRTFLPSHLPAKAFEYLHAGKPILAIADQGELTEILTKSGLGIVVRPHSAELVANALRGLVADHAAGRLTRTPNLPYIRSFERTALAERLARVLDALKDGAHARP
jgi:glycosyltransferase involved in cell wall biosynthesis